MKRTITTISLGCLIAFASLLGVGCAEVGTCHYSCRGEKGFVNKYGPFYDETEGECEDRAEEASAPDLVCWASWVAYED